MRYLSDTFVARSGSVDFALRPRAIVPHPTIRTRPTPGLVSRSAVRIGPDGKPIRSHAPSGKPNCGVGSGGFKPGNTCGKGKRKQFADEVVALRRKANLGQIPHATLRQHVLQLKKHRTGVGAQINDTEAKQMRDAIRLGRLHGHPLLPPKPVAKPAPVVTPAPHSAPVVAPAPHPAPLVRQVESNPSNGLPAAKITHNLTPEDRQSFDKIAHHIFGKQVNPENIGALVGAQDGARLAFRLDPTKNKLFVETHSDVMYSARHISKDENGEIIVDNEKFKVKGLKGGGLGAKVFGQQVENGRKMGVAKMLTVAASGDRQNGYNTWARFGYTGKIPPTAINKLRGAKGLPKELRRVHNVQDLMLSPEGTQWWEKNGSTFEGTFSLRPGSPSLKFWDEYQKEKAGLRPDRTGRSKEKVNGVEVKGDKHGHYLRQKQEQKEIRKQLAEGIRAHRDNEGKDKKSHRDIRQKVIAYSRYRNNKPNSVSEQEAREIHNHILKKPLKLEEINGIKPKSKEHANYLRERNELKETRKKLVDGIKGILDHNQKDKFYLKNFRKMVLDYSRYRRNSENKISDQYADHIRDLILRSPHKWKPDPEKNFQVIRPEDIDEWGKEHFSEWGETLNQEEKDIISAYAIDSYDKINKYMRNGRKFFDFRTGKNYKDHDLDHQIYTLTNAISRAKAPRNIVVYRGVDEDAFKNNGIDINKLRTGDKIDFKGFTSTSLSPRPNLSYHHIVIMVPEGTSGAYLNAAGKNLIEHPEEHEFLLPESSSKFRFVKVEDHPNQTEFAPDRKIITFQIDP